MPDEWKRRLESEVTVDDMYLATTDTERGWMHAEGGQDYDVPVMRHFAWNRHPKFPTILSEMMQYTDCKDISMFISDDTAPGSLWWHVDWYDVFAFNMEGETTWEWFCLRDGCLKSEVLKPLDNVLIMPSGISHRVVLNTPFRASISLVADRRNG